MNIEAKEIIELNVLSTKTDFNDLTIEEWSKVYFDSAVLPFDFVLTSEMIDRIILAGRIDILFICLKEFDISLIHCTEQDYDKFLGLVKEEFPGSKHFASSIMWASATNQFSIEFLKKYKDCIGVCNIHNQKSLTLDFVYENLNSIYAETFFDETYFDYIDSDILEDETRSLLLKDALNYKEGVFEKYIFPNNFDLAEIAQEEFEEKIGIVPKYFSTVIDEHRILSGEPCNNGKRSYLIWLAKFRRIKQDPQAYPTWGELYTLSQEHPLMDRSGYIAWIWDNVLFNSEEDMKDYGSTVTFTKDDNEELTIKDIPETVIDNMTGAGTSSILDDTDDWDDEDYGADDELYEED